MQAGKYRLVKLIGRGGMGEVWEGALAGEKGFARRVAIKKMIGKHDGGWEHRFLEEARIASRLHHANIVSVLDFGVEDGAYFQVLELIDGIDARHVFERAHERGTPLPVELALHICIEVAHGLQSAHAAQDEAGRPLHIVHRDVSLENVLVSWQGDVKLSDFGVAKARDRGFQTAAAGIVGKPAYMAPEQATGGEVDARTDVFALGCALHALLTGVTPLAGEDAMAKLLTGNALVLDASIPDDVRGLIAKAVTRTKAERFPSAGAMAEAMAVLRHARMSQDPRVALRDFLAPMAPKKRAMGALDALLLAPEEKDVVRPEMPSPTPAEPNAPTVTRAPAPRRALPWLAVGGALAVAAGAAAWRVMGQLDAGEVVPPAPVGAAAVEKPAPVLEPAPPPPPTPPPERAPAPVAAPARKKPPTAATAEMARGTLVVGGEGAQRAEIFVDGASQGFAPKRLELVVGSHDVVLVKPDGTRVGPKRVDVTARNTDLAPLKWLVQE
ncbi:MAG: serine/threonine protein kinase [Myxococcaceae bacterium]|nr:serine/threonine protein kinase [Myxococcaceae bacterium]